MEYISTSSLNHIVDLPEDIYYTISHRKMYGWSEADIENEVVSKIIPALSGNYLQHIIVRSLELTLGYSEMECKMLIFKCNKMTKEVI